jgi:catalase
MHRQTNEPSQLVTRRPRGIPLYLLVAAVGAGLVTIGALFAGWLHARSAQPLAPARIVDLFESDAGQHPGFRRNHAKGVCVTGHFDSNGRGAALSRASVFVPGTVAFIGRFSTPGGHPGQQDGSAAIRSLALFFTLRGGEQWRTAMNSAPVFTVATPQALVEELKASRPDSRTGQVDPAQVAAFVQRHPETQALRDWEQTHPPSSDFDNAAYYSVNVFRFTDAQGHVHDVRWRVEPERHYEPMRQAQTSDPDFLAHDLNEHLMHGPARWHLMLTEAARGDPIHDATRAWPHDSRHLDIDAGTLFIEHAQAQIDGPCRDIDFDPLVLPAGIAASDDPLLAARSVVYAESLHRRTMEEAEARSGLAQGTGLRGWVTRMESWFEPGQAGGVRHGG